MDRLLPNVNVKQLIAFFKMLLLCGNYAIVKLVFENSTEPILDPIVFSMSGYSSIFINIDAERHNSIHADISSDEHSLIICVFDEDPLLKINNIGPAYNLQQLSHFLFASRHPYENAISRRVMTFARQNFVDNVGLILLKPNGTFKLSRLIYDQDSDVKIPTFDSQECSIYDKLFYPKSKDFKGEDKYVHALLDPPRTLNISSLNENGNQVFGMGGREAYFASLIPNKVNITIKLWTFRLSEYDINDILMSKKLNFFLKEFLEKAYETDNLIPKQVEYMTFVKRDDVLKL